MRKLFIYGSALLCLLSVLFFVYSIVVGCLLFSVLFSLPAGLEQFDKDLKKKTEYELHVIYKKHYGPMIVGSIAASSSPSFSPAGFNLLLTDLGWRAAFSNSPEGFLFPSMLTESHEEDPMPGLKFPMSNNSNIQSKSTDPNSRKLIR